MKKIITLMLSLLMIFGIYVVNAKNIDLVLTNGTTVYYKGTNIAVKIPEEYKMPETYFRGAWVTPLAGSLPSYSTKEAYKREINEMFDILEYYNCNAVVFHIRIMNDALYPSKLNPKSGYMNTNEDMLSWVIEESHKRGIEFHAWLNPYRVQASGSTDLTRITNKYKSYPNNPASNADNLLVNNAGGVILNPCLENVRQFIVDTVVEVMDNYDVDAIHFDDYFYISDVDDESFYKTLNPTNLGKSDWRREQVNMFIKKLSETMKDYNKKNNRNVQLGISPTGIYNNGDGEVTYDDNGNAISSGSKTGGQCHYESYLFSDTLKWINMEWIDYICPQSYWGFSHPIAGYADVMSWWNKVVKYKKVNLYSGMGIYMAENPGRNYSWGFDSNEAVNQILYASTLENVDGTCFYSYNYLEYTYKGSRDTLYGKGLTRIKEEVFTSPSLLPHIKSMNCSVQKVDKINLVEKNDTSIKFNFNGVDNAKFYVVYRSSGELTYKPEEVYKIFGSKDDVVNFVDTYEKGKEYNYAVRVMAGDNSLSEPEELLAIKYNVIFKDEDGNTLKEVTVNQGQSVTPPQAPVKAGRTFISWSRDLTNISSDLVIYPKYNDSLYTVTFYDYLGNVLKTENVKRNASASAPEALREGFEFDKWDIDYSNVIYDLDVHPLYKTKFCTVKFVDYDGTELLTYQIAYGKEGYFPNEPERVDYDFVGWSSDLKKVTEDIIVTPIYEIQKVKVTLVNAITEEVIEELYVDKNSDVVFPEPPFMYGYKFEKWYGDSKNLKYDTKIIAMYTEICYMLTFVDIDGNVVEEREMFWFEDPEYPTLPEVKGYKFIGWDTDLSKLPSDKEELLISPIYEKLFITIKFVDGEGNIISQVDVNTKEELENVKAPNAPEVKGFDFVGWDKEISKDFVDQVIKAVYKAKEFTVIFLDKDGKEIKTQKVAYGNDADTEFKAPEIEGYEFVGWDKTITNVTEDITVKALYNAKEYTVKFVDKDGNEIASQKVAYGQDANMDIEIPEVEGYKFKGFSNDGKNIKEDTTIILEYTKDAGCKLFTVINLLLSLSFVFVVMRFTKKH